MTYFDFVCKCLRFISKTGLSIYTDPSYRYNFGDFPEDVPANLNKYYGSEFDCSDDSDGFSDLDDLYKFADCALKYVLISEIYKFAKSEQLKKYLNYLFEMLARIELDIGGCLRDFIDAYESDLVLKDILMSLCDPELTDDERARLDNQYSARAQELEEEIPLDSQYMIEAYPIQNILMLVTSTIPYLYFSFSGYKYIDPIYHIFDDKLRQDLFNLMRNVVDLVLQERNFYIKFNSENTKKSSDDDIWSFDSYFVPFLTDISGYIEGGQPFYIVLSLLFTVLDMIKKREYDKLRKLLALDKEIVNIQRDVFNKNWDEPGQSIIFFIGAKEIPNYYDIIPDDIKSQSLDFFLSNDEMTLSDLALIAVIYGRFGDIQELAIDRDWERIVARLKEYYLSVYAGQITFIRDVSARKKRALVTDDVTKRKEILKNTMRGN